MESLDIKNRTPEMMQIQGGGAAGEAALRGKPQGPSHLQEPAARRGRYRVVNFPYP